MSTKHVRAALDRLSKMRIEQNRRFGDSGLVTLGMAAKEVVAHEAAHDALRRLLNAFPTPGSEEEADAVAEAHKALAALAALEEP